MHVWVRRGLLVPLLGPRDGAHGYRFDYVALSAWRCERMTFGEALVHLGVSKATLHRWVEEQMLNVN